MQNVDLKQVVSEALEDAKARDITCMDVTELTDVTDYMIVVSGTSSTHVKSIVNHVLERIRDIGVKAIGVEGREDGEWVLVDLGDVVLHVMQPKVRDFYDLERLWSMSPTRTESTL